MAVATHSPKWSSCYVRGRRREVSRTDAVLVNGVLKIDIHSVYYDMDSEITKRHVAEPVWIVHLCMASDHSTADVGDPARLLATPTPGQRSHYRRRGHPLTQMPSQY
jgi:hypothetical protein